MAGADLAFALQLADLADSLSLPRFRAGDLRIETKPDLSPVTDADRAVERALRERIAVERPGEGVLGEEEGDDGGDIRWILDPIDGTRNFSRGLPVWATLIALERDHVLTAAVVSAPALGRRWWASRGGGAFADGAPIGVSRVPALHDASVSCSLAHDLALVEPVAWHARGLGDFWQHVLVAEGALDAAVDTKLELWDSAAVELVVTEAGGSAGVAADGQFVTTNRVVHDELLALLRDR